MQGVQLGPVQDARRSAPRPGPLPRAEGLSLPTHTNGAFLLAQEDQWLPCDACSVRNVSAFVARAREAIGARGVRMLPTGRLRCIVMPRVELNVGRHSPTMPTHRPTLALDNHRTGPPCNDAKAFIDTLIDS